MQLLQTGDGQRGGGTVRFPTESTTQLEVTLLQWKIKTIAGTYQLSSSQPGIIKYVSCASNSDSFPMFQSVWEEQRVCVCLCPRSSAIYVCVCAFVRLVNFHISLPDLHAVVTSICSRAQISLLAKK